MFNAVELVLMLMSMFSLVNQENRRAVWFLFEISLSYDMTTGRFRMTHQSYDAFLQLFGPLSALASYRGMACDNVSNPSVMEVYAMLCTILHPILGHLSANELQEIHNSAEEGLQILFLDLAKFELIVKTWTRDARDDHRLARWTDLNAARGSITSSSTKASPAAVDSPLGLARERLLTCWTPKVIMDDRVASSVLSYCAGFAAASTQVSVRRAQRVKPRKTSASDSSTLSTISPIPTLHRRNCAKTHKTQPSQSTDDFGAPQVSLQRASRFKTQKIQSPASSTDGDSFISSPGAWKAIVSTSHSAPELGAAFAQYPYPLRRAASALVLSLGDDQFDTSFFYSSDYGFDIDHPRLDSPVFQSSASYMKPPSTPLKRGVPCSLDSFESVRSTMYYSNLGSCHAAANTSQRYSSIILASSDTFLIELNTHEGGQDWEWEMVTPPVGRPVRALPGPARALKRKRAMHDLRAGWVFPPRSISLEPCGSKTMYATKVATDSRSRVGGFVRNAWWATPGLDDDSNNSRPALLAPSVAPILRTTPYHTCHSRSLLAPSTVTLCPSSTGTSLVSTPLQTPRSSAEDLPFVEWVDEWEASGPRRLWARDDSSARR